MTAIDTAIPTTETAPQAAATYDDGESYDAGDDGEVVVDDETATRLFHEACAAAAAAGL